MFSSFALCVIFYLFVIVSIEKEKLTYRIYFGQDFKGFVSELAELKSNLWKSRGCKYNNIYIWSDVSNVPIFCGFLVSRCVYALYIQTATAYIIVK